MNFQIIKIDRLSGSQTSVYTVVIEGESKSLFDQFVEESSAEHSAELKNILERLIVIGRTVGARVGFFKENEGKPGDLVSALYDDPDALLRLYCIRYGKTAVLLGGGGPKAHDVRAWQDDPVLTKHAKLMIEVSNRIAVRMKEKEIRWSLNQMDLIGDLNFNEDQED